MKVRSQPIQVFWQTRREITKIMVKRFFLCKKANNLNSYLEELFHHHHIQTKRLNVHICCRVQKRSAEKTAKNKSKSKDITSPGYHVAIYKFPLTPLVVSLLGKSWNITDFWEIVWHENWCRQASTPNPSEKAKQLENYHQIWTLK